MKHKDLKPCCVCGKGVCHDQQPLSTRIKVTRMVVNIPAVQRQTGLEMMLGGNATIANAMGPDEDMLVPLDKEADLLICDQCAMTTTIAELWEDMKPAAAIPVDLGG